MATSVEQIVNQALYVAGHDRRIANIYDGSLEAQIAIELYGQARDELLDLQDWSFSSRTAPLSLLKGPPPAQGYSFVIPWSNLYPTPGWLYEYAYPADCLDARAILQQPTNMPDLDPLPAEFRVSNDPTPIIENGIAVGPPAKVIYCNVTDALLTYRAKITDPSTFDTGFTAALVDSLAKKFAKAFGATVDEQREDDGEAIAVTQYASSIRG